MTLLFFRGAFQSEPNERVIFEEVMSPVSEATLVLHATLAKLAVVAGE